ncbi:MAG: ribonuclease [Rubrivivax sp.]|nr:ribonuclease [Rubrivivax sp.]
MASLWPSLRKLGLAWAVAACLAPVAGVQARSAPGEPGSVALAALPLEAQQTAVLIRRGGPFPYAKDGSVFGNRERLLPQRRRGYYREYTVPTPQARDRGARRIICGGARPAEPVACYYTADHYASFTRIAP